MNYIRRFQYLGNFVRFEVKIAGMWVWIFTHFRSHLDEVEPAFRLMKSGTKEFVKKHGIKVEATGEYVIRIGCLKGEFDEHRPYRGERKKGECAATLVAAAMAAKEDAALKYTKANDVYGQDVENGLASTLWMLQRMFPDRQDEVVNWGLTALKSKDMAAPDDEDFSVDKIATYVAKKLPKHADAWCKLLAEGRAAQAAAFKAAVEQVKTEGRVMIIDGPKDKKQKVRKLRLLVIKSDNTEVARASRFKDSGANADIVVVHNDRGQVNINRSARSGLTFFDLAQVLHCEEKKVRGDKTFDTWRELSSEGSASDNIWFFASASQSLLNGSLTAPAIEPTKLSLDSIIEYIKIAVQPGKFCLKTCWMAGCTSERDDPCPWYDWGLQRCRRTRAVSAEE